MSNNGFLALLLNNESSLSMGPTLYGFLHQGKFPPLSLRCPTRCFPPYTSALFDLVKLDLAFLQMSPFTHEGVKSSSKADPLSY